WRAVDGVGPEHERRDGIGLKTEGDGGVRAVGPGCSVLFFFLPHAREIILQDVHPAARIVIEKAIQRYLDVDSNDVVCPRAGRRRAPRAGAYAFAPLVAGECDAFRFLVAGGLSTSRRVARALRCRHPPPPPRAR